VDAAGNGTQSHAVFDAKALMTNDDVYQPADGSWGEYARLPGFRAVLDPTDILGRKNHFIDRLHRLAIDQRVRAPLRSVVLDLGCGTGRIARHFDQRGARVVGLDITSQSLRVAADHSPNTICYVRSDGATLPIRSNSVDTVVSVYVLQYVVRTRQIYRRLVAEIARVLRVGGRWIFLEQEIGSRAGSGSVGSTIHRANYLDWDAMLPLSVGGSWIVRLGAPSRLEQRTLLSRDVPGVVEELLIRWILRRNRRLPDAVVDSQPYVDRLFVVERHA
jgi:SAM-dependent methyltransferase